MKFLLLTEESHFEEIVQRIQSGAKVIETDHPDKKKYLKQKIMIVDVDGSSGITNNRVGLHLSIRCNNNLDFTVRGSKKMKKRTIYISSFDKERLVTLIEKSDNANNNDKKYLKELEKELNRSKIVEQNKMPQDVITMNSKVRLKELDSGEEITYVLVFPEAANIDENKISILAPIGTALIGYRVGDIIEWEVPAGLRRLKVEELLYQPEAAGDYHL
ncbi:Regulator of nucleoside diphosphate kinase [Candidatus Brocadiaceae bacterium S225]|uniref:Transcription elongation factor n=1 Tax=Candidatus Scalindua brodae TaxID=237368 RepID=A0A0B0EDS0_9BACT|nr:MAG: transcription elongation factor [Candidatus Scalindua brodae]TWU33965.1 Regulator of nucleoside diphosphate kinase [Candidatus Brocadiaceae bacterium S225]